MRKILFRGKRIDNGKWVEGYFFAKPILEKYFIIEGENQWMVDPKTVGQWTGLVDKNGVKVFEGDIVNLRSDHDMGHELPCKRCVIEFDEYHRFVAITPSRLAYPLANRYEWEVISNIHDKAVEE